MKKLFLFIFLQSILLLYAQNPEDYNRIYAKTYIETSQKDFSKALKIADSLYTVSETPRFKTKSLMLSASLYQQLGEIKKAVDYATKAEQIVKNSEDYEWQSKIYGFLSTQYRNLGLFDQSKKYIDQTEQIISKIGESKSKNHILSLVMQENAYYELEKKQYKNSIDFIIKAQNYFNQVGQENDFTISGYEQLLGLNYYYLKDYNKALGFYNKALEKLDKMPDNYIKGLVYNGLAQIYIEKKNTEEAQKYIANAEKIADESSYLSLKNEIYKTSQSYYTLVKNIEQLEKTKVKQDSVTEKLTEHTLEFIRESYSGIEKKNEEIKKENHSKNVIILSAVFLLLVGITYFMIYRRKQKRNYEKIRRILEEIQTNKNSISIEEPATDTEIFEEKPEENEPENPAQAMMSPATEKKLLAKLDKFEQTTLFTRNTISLPYLASYCDTNIKYISYIINTHKQKDFNNYINELRIKYIIGKLKSDPEYQKYKISTLAVESGFSSLSKFGVAFKKVTEVSPSQFLQHIKINH